MARRQTSSYVGLFVMAIALVVVGEAADNNKVYRPCLDTTVQRNDGFTFAMAFAPNSSFYNKNVQLSPCDKQLTGVQGGQVAVFRPKVDEISLLVINITNFNPEFYGGYGVVYAGRQYAAVSKPVFLANGSYHVTSLSMVLNFDKGRLVNVLWKNDNCASCQGKNTTFVCLNGEQCAVKSSLCNTGDPKTKVDCSLTIQLTFSGTDKYQDPLNSWYQLQSMQQYSLLALYGNLKKQLENQFHLYF
ncbi:unnamed protein product [Calypogeia fissa]